MDNKDFDIDSLFDGQDAFKPLTKGLGFHHSLKSQEEVESKLKSSSESLRNDLEKRARTLNTTVTINTASAVDRGDLSPFYAQTPQVEAQAIFHKEEELETPVIKVSQGLRFAAWSIDLVVVLFMYAMTLGAIILLAQVPSSIFSDMSFWQELLKITAPLAVFFYLFYFSFFDKTSFSTLGKRAFNLRVVDAANNELTMFQAFLRAFVTLAGIFSLGLVSLLDFQGKMTETKVIKS